MILLCALECACRCRGPGIAAPGCGCRWTATSPRPALRECHRPIAVAGCRVQGTGNRGANPKRGRLLPPHPLTHTNTQGGQCSGSTHLQPDSSPGNSAVSVDTARSVPASSSTDTIVLPMRPRCTTPAMQFVYGYVAGSMCLSCRVHVGPPPGNVFPWTLLGMVATVFSMRSLRDGQGRRRRSCRRPIGMAPTTS